MAGEKAVTRHAPDGGTESTKTAHGRSVGSGDG